MKILLFECFIFASSIDFAAGGFPNVTGYRYGIDAFTWVPNISPTPAEPAADFAARLQTAINLQFQNFLTSIGSSATFTPFTVTDSVVLLNQRFTISGTTITVPSTEQAIFSTVGSNGQIQTGAGLIIEYDRAAATPTSSDFQVLTLQDTSCTTGLNCPPSRGSYDQKQIERVANGEI